MNPTNTPFSVQTVGARRRGPKRTIFIAYQTWENPRSRVKKKKKKSRLVSWRVRRRKLMDDVWRRRRCRSGLERWNWFDSRSREPKILRRPDPSKGRDSKSRITVKAKSWFTARKTWVCSDVSPGGRSKSWRLYASPVHNRSSRRGDRARRVLGENTKRVAVSAATKPQSRCYQEFSETARSYFFRVLGENTKRVAGSAATDRLSSSLAWEE